MTTATTAGSADAVTSPKKTKARTKGQRRRAGRRRRVDVTRHADGQIVRTSKQKREEGPVIPVQVIERRAEIVGAENTSDQRAGTALGQMLLLGLIDQTQHDAGMRLAELWQSWSCMACRPRFPTDGRPVIVDAENPDEEVIRRWRRLKERMAAVRQDVLALPAGALAWSMVESAVAEDIIPPRLDPRSALHGNWPLGKQAMRDGLTAVARAMGAIPA